LIATRCSQWRTFALTHARSRVCHWLMASSMMSWGIRSQSQSMSVCFSWSMSSFGFYRAMPCKRGLCRHAVSMRGLFARVKRQTTQHN